MTSVSNLQLKTIEKIGEFVKKQDNIFIRENINWCAIGDSFTYGDNTHESFTDRNGKVWSLTATTWLANEIKANLYQVGLGGAHLMPRIIDGEIDPTLSNYVTNEGWWYGMKNLPSNADIITIQLGLNDNGVENFPIGQYGDATLLTSYGAFKILMDKIKSVCPFTKVGLIVSDAWLSTKYAEFLYDVAEKYQLPLLDLNLSQDGTIYGTSAGTSYNYNFAPSDIKTSNNALYRISSTNGHPNIESQKIRANKLKPFINELLGGKSISDASIINKQVSEYFSTQFVTPEMFGAIGDGITDDSEALNLAFKTCKPIIFGSKKTYKSTRGIYVEGNLTIIGNGATILFEEYTPVSDDTYGVIRYRYGLTDYNVSIKDLTVIYADTNYQFEDRHLYIYNFIGANEIIFDNVTTIVKETENNRHIITVTCPKSSFKNCRFENLSYGDKGGCLWIDVEGEKAVSFIDNCSFKQNCSDEILAGYNTAKKLIVINSSDFYFDSTAFPKATIPFAFYEGDNNVTFNSCNIEQVGDVTNRVHGIIRIGSKNGDKIRITMNSCAIKAENSNGIFTTDNPAYQTYDSVSISINNCDVINNNGSIFGNYYSYKQDNTIVTYAAPSCLVDNSRLVCRKTLIDIPNTAKYPVTIAIKNSIINMIDSVNLIYGYNLSVLRCIIDNSMIYVDNDIEKVYNQNSSIELLDEAHTIEEIRYVNTYLNKVLITE